MAMAAGGVGKAENPEKTSSAEDVLEQIEDIQHPLLPWFCHGSAGIYDHRPCLVHLKQCHECQNPGAQSKQSQQLRLVEVEDD